MPAAPCQCPKPRPDGCIVQVVVEDDVEHLVEEDDGSPMWPRRRRCLRFGGPEAPPGQRLAALGFPELGAGTPVVGSRRGRRQGRRRRWDRSGRAARVRKRFGRTGSSSPTMPSPQRHRGHGSSQPAVRVARHARTSNQRAGGPLGPRVAIHHPLARGGRPRLGTAEVTDGNGTAVLRAGRLGSPRPRQEELVS